MQATFWVAVSTILSVGIASAAGAQSNPTLGALHGVVTTAAGEPAAGADVRLIGTPRATVTAADGAFRFDGLRPGSYVLESSSDRFGAAVETVRVEAGGDVAMDLVLEREVHREEVVVTASPDPRGASELAQPAAQLGGSELMAAIRPTLGETLTALPGVHQTFFGAGSSRPVIRGVGGDRIRVLEDGIGTGDASSASPDHAVTIDPSSAEQVEVVRGPATLLYGSSAVGGVVNVLTESVPATLPGEPITGTLTLGAGSVASGRSGSLQLQGSGGRFAWRVDGFRREEDDYESGAGLVRNSFVESDGGGAGASYVGDHGFLGASYGRFTSDYGNPGEPAAPVTIGMEQRRWNLRGEWLSGGGGGGGRVRGLKVRAGGADYEHTEFEGDEVGTRFRNDSEEMRLELLHGFLGPFGGAVGLQASRRDFAAVGEEAFVPPSETETLAAFLFEEVVTGAVRWQFGGRYETADLEAAPSGGALRRSYSGVSGSVGAVWTPDPAWSLAAAAARSVKLPNAEELFSDGPHIATLSFEIGDPNLDEETSLGLDLSARRRLGRFTGEVSVFANRFDDYIFEEFTGVLTEPEEGEEPLRIVRYVQRDAEFYGAEMLGHYELLHSDTTHLELEVGADFVRAKLVETGEPLPRIPPRRLSAGLRYRSGAWNGSLEARRVDEQRYTSENETATDGYTALNASLGYRFFAGDTVHDVVLTGTNLSDEEARNHVSFLKDAALLPGRDVRLSYRLAF